MADCNAAVALCPGEAWPLFHRSLAHHDLYQLQVCRYSHAFASRWQKHDLAAVESRDPTLQIQQCS